MLMFTFFQLFVYNFLFTFFFISVAGWGTIYFGGPTSQDLLEVDVGIWKNSDCANNYRRLNRNVLDTMMCAGDATGGGDACQVIYATMYNFQNSTDIFGQIL